MLITLLANILPSCLLPKFIEGVFKEGASMIPLDELPINKLQYFKHDK